MPLFSVYYNGNKLLALNQALIVPLISMPGSKIKWLFKNHLSQGVPQAFERWAFFHVKGSTRSAKHTRRKKPKSFPIKTKKSARENARAGSPGQQDCLGRLAHHRCPASAHETAAELAPRWGALPEEYGTHPLHFFFPSKKAQVGWMYYSVCLAALKLIIRDFRSQKDRGGALPQNLNHP